MVTVTMTASRTRPRARKFINRPPFLKEWKNPGPTWSPTENTKRIRPKSFMKLRTVGSTLRPKWLRRMATNRIQVDPMDTPLILNLPRYNPVATTKAKTRIECAIPVPKNKSLIIH